MHGSLPTRLRVLRAERGLTLRDAEHQTGVDKDTLSKIERGVRHPHDVTLAKIAKGYGVPVEDLLEEPALAGKVEASETGPDIARARSEALRHWEQGHKAIAQAIADAFGFSVSDLMEEPPASLAEAPRGTGQPRAGSAAEGHQFWRSTWEQFKNLTPEEQEEFFQNVEKGRATFGLEVLQDLAEGAISVEEAAERLHITR